jgi:hypothetical protein
MSNDDELIGDVLPLSNPLTPEEAQKEVERIFTSFSKEFKDASLQLLRTKVLARMERLQKQHPDRNPVECMERAWAEISLEMMMILTDGITKTALMLQEAEGKLKAVKHLMPETSTRPQ